MDDTGEGRDLPVRKTTVNLLEERQLVQAAHLTAATRPDPKNVIAKLILHSTGMG